MIDLGIPRIQIDDPPSITALILTWNNKGYVLQVLSDLHNLSYPLERLKIVVIDNASNDGTVNAIKEVYGEIGQWRIEKKGNFTRLAQDKAQHPFSGFELLLALENLGGTGGFNSGLRWFLEYSTDSLVWLIDNDVRLHEHCLSYLVKALQDDPKIGMAGSRMADINHPEVCVEIGTIFDVKTGSFTPFYPKTSMYDFRDGVFPLPSCPACSLLVRRDVIESVGLWDERFFLYMDDVDFGLRVNEAGYKVVAVSNSVIWHIIWALKPSPQRLYYAKRNLLWTMEKHLTGKERLEAIREQVKGLFAEAWYNYMTRRLNQTYAIYFAVDDFLSNRRGRFDRRLVEKQINTDDFLSRLRKTRLPSAFLIVDESDNEAASEFFKFLLDKGVRIKPVILDLGENDLHESLSGLKHIRIDNTLRMRKKVLKAGLHLLPLLFGRVFVFSYRHELYLPPMREFYRVGSPQSIKESRFSLIRDITSLREHKKRAEAIYEKIARHYE